MKSTRIQSAIAAASLLVIAGSTPRAAAQPAIIPAGRTVLTFVNRLLINPPQVLVFGYFPSVDGIPGPLFSGAPGESTAYFTFSLDAAGASTFQNGDANASGNIGVAVLASGHNFNVYFNANPNQSWNNPASFSAGQLIATFQSTTGTQTSSGPVALVTQSYVLVSSENFSFKSQTYNFERIIPHGFTSIALSGNIPLGNPIPSAPPLIFSAAGSGLAIGGSLSGLPQRF